MEKMWINYGETIENLWNLCGTLMDILCASDGKVMEILWKFCETLMEKLRNLCGSFMEKILDWNMENMWRIANVEHLCGIDTLENYRLENIKTR